MSYQSDTLQLLQSSVQCIFEVDLESDNLLLYKSIKHTLTLSVWCKWSSITLKISLSLHLQRVKAVYRKVCTCTLKIPLFILIALWTSKCEGCTQKVLHLQNNTSWLLFEFCQYLSSTELNKHCDMLIQNGYLIVTDCQKNFLNVQVFLNSLRYWSTFFGLVISEKTLKF